MKKNDYTDKAWLEYQYVELEKSIDALANMCNTDKKNIIYYLNEYRIFRKIDHSKHPKRW